MNLVTGATGLVGSHVLLTLLLQGKKVVAAKRPGSDLLEVERVFSFYTPDHKELFSKIIWRDIDLNDVVGLVEVLKDIKNVYHCAALVSLNNSDRNLLFKINTEGTANMVNASLACNIETFCYVSSITTIQDPEHKGELDETIFWKNRPLQSAYSQSKYQAEQEVYRGIEEGLSAVIVNPGVIVGPGNWNRGTGKLFSVSSKGVKFYTEGINGFVGVMDVAEIMVKLVDKKITGERFILIEGNYSFKEILEKIHNSLGKNPPAIKAGKSFLQLGRILTFLLPENLKINNSMIETLTEKVRYSNRKLLSFIQHKYTPIDDCIRFSGEIYQKQSPVSP